MKNRRSRFLPQAADRGSVTPGLPFAERPARHRSWSAAISGAYRRTQGMPPWGPVTFIFGLHAKRMLSLVRRVLNLRLSWSRREQTLAVNNNVLVQQLLSVHHGISTARADSHSETAGLRAATLAFGQSYTLQPLSHVETRSLQRIWLQGPALTRSQWLPSSASTSRLGLRPKVIPQDANVPEMTIRIARRLRRVEKAPFSPEPSLAAGAAPARGFEEMAERPARRLHRDASPVNRSQLAATGPIQPGVNVTQLTDEVLRQIDRRLVGVRERMGKI